MRVRAGVPMCEPMGQLVHEGEQLLLRVQIRAQDDQIAPDSTLHPFRQSGAHQSGATVLEVGLQ